MAEEPSFQLEEGLHRLGVPYSESQLAKLGIFLDELERWNRRFGLVARSDPLRRRLDRSQLIVRHVLDSLAGWSTLEAMDRRREVADVGSGAGFPGIPLALFLPDSQFTLLEPSTKKAAFLRNVAILADLENVEVAETRLADVERRFDLVVLRAFSPLTRSLSDLYRILLPKGMIVAYKGKWSRILEESEAARLDMNRLRIVPLSVPFLDEERHLLVIPTAS